MGSCGITMRQSDCGLDLLGIIVAEQLRKVDFATFNVTDALEALRQNIQNEIEQHSQQQRPPELKRSYMESLLHDFAHTALLVAECLAGYYQTGELIVFDFPAAIKTMRNLLVFFEKVKYNGCTQTVKRKNRGGLHSDYPQRAGHYLI